MHADLAALALLAHVRDELARVHIRVGQVLGEREHGPRRRRVVRQRRCCRLTLALVLSSKRHAALRTAAITAATAAAFAPVHTQIDISYWYDCAAADAHVAVCSDNAAIAVAGGGGYVDHS